jgi:hypothetical protein
MSPSNRNNPVFEQNECLADQINEEALRNPNSPYAGKFVGIANGQVVTVADSSAEVVRQLEQVEPDRMKCYCFEAGIDYNRVLEIWSLH